MSQEAKVVRGTEEPGRTGPGWSSSALALMVYSVGLAAATWPFLLALPTALPSLVDPLTHLWTMKWYRRCLLEGLDPFVHTGIQFPIGASMGNLPPMHLQTLLFVPISAIVGEDILAFNLVWWLCMLLTGMGTFALAWHMVGHRGGAILAGLLVMLGAPVLTHGRAHLEQVTLGFFPLFLIAWMRLVDRPSAGRVLAATLLYLLLAMSAPYFGLLGAFPAALYLIWAGIRDGRGARGKWLRGRLLPLSGFLGMAIPAVGLLFSPQLWAVARGLAPPPPAEEFSRYGAPWWSYFVPSRWHALGGLLPADPYEAAGVEEEALAYLGLVAILLLVVALIGRAKFPRVGFCWAAFGLMILLSMGASTRVGSLEVGLPSGWLHEFFPPFRLIRVPARLSLFASVFAAVLAASGLKLLLGRVRSAPWRGAILGLAIAGAVLDLAIVPYGPREPLPAMPGCYEWALRRDPDATFLEVPQTSTGGAERLAALCAYWQSIHGGRTNAGYSARQNVALDQLLTLHSPFAAGLLSRPGYPQTPESMGLDVLGQVAFLDHVRLYLQAHGFRYVVLHRRPGAYPEFPVHVDRIAELLAEGKVYEDDSAILIDRDRLPPPSRAVAVCRGGWNERLAYEGRFSCVTSRVSEVLVENPDPTRPLQVGLEARSVAGPRVVRLLRAGRELARFRFEPGSYQLQASPAFHLPGGRSLLTLECDRAATVGQAPSGEPIREPVGLLVSGLTLVPAPDSAVDRIAARSDGEAARATSDLP